MDESEVTVGIDISWEIKERKEWLENKRKTEKRLEKENKKNQTLLKCTVKCNSIEVDPIKEK